MCRKTSAAGTSQSNGPGPRVHMALASEGAFGLFWHCPTNFNLNLSRTSVKHSPLVRNDRVHISLKDAVYPHLSVGLRYV